MLAEGEVALILAGYALHHGYLDPLPTLLMGTAGGTCSDSLYYWLGRRFGARIIRARPALRPLRIRAVVLLRRWGHITAFATRFAFGLRIALPIAMGAARMHPRVFHLYNALGALTFAVVYLGIGFGFGRVVHQLFVRSGLSEVQLIGAVVVLVALIWLGREWMIYRRVPTEMPPVKRRR